jgi:DNA-binding PadR family transcriptional regulator
MVARAGKRRPSPSNLSEIEACVLGLVSLGGPSTPYAIRKVFLESPSPQWSGSAGTIYPLMQRLLCRKLIRSKSCLTGKRRANRISLTASGSWTLKQWLNVRIPDWVAGVPPDPLRTRFRFFGVVGGKQLRRFLQDAYDRTQTHLAAIKADCARKRSRGQFEYLTARGALLTMQSRCAFLREVAGALGLRLADFS